MLLQYQIGQTDDSVTDPSADEIRRVITELGDRDSAVLLHDEATYMQVIINGDEILLEHQDGSLQQFFEAPPDVTREQTIEAFVSYSQNSSWQTEILWTHIPPEDFNLDFTILASLPEDALDGKAEVNFDGHLEMPYIGIYHWVTLYQQLCGGDFDDLEEEFVLLCEAEAETNARIYMYPLPAQLTVALENLDHDAISKLAEQWWGSEEFPSDEVLPQEAATLVHEIHQMAREAAAQSEILIVCELLYGEEEE